MLFRSMNHLYKDVPALHEVDFDGGGFQWIDCNDAENSTLSYLRRDIHGGIVVVILNLTPVPRHGYRLGVPKPGHYSEILNTDSELYGGGNIGNAGGVLADDHSWMDQPHSITVTLPPLSCVILRPDQE